jgi:hypothetical protein
MVAGRYAVLGELGRGGIGVVWRAEDRTIGRQVALKELRVPAGLSTAEHGAFTERVLREARTAGRLSDPSIVTVYDVLLDDGAMFIVMELVEATTLADVVNARGPLPADRVAAIGLQVLSALETAHAAGVVHRDVKPSNIMLLRDGRVKLADFGIAQALDDPSLTGTGGVMGSPGYMAPELFEGSRPSPAGDLWSLGATLFHLVEGQPPFQRDTTAATIHAVMYTRPAPSRANGPLAAAITGLLARSPDDRLTAARARNLLTRTDEPATEIMAPLPTVRVDADRTTVTDRTAADRTAAVRTAAVRTTALRKRSTRPLADPPLESPQSPPWAGDAWAGDAWAGDPKPQRNRRRVLLAAGAAVLVLAVAGVAIALTGNHSTAAAGPAEHTAHTESAAGTTAATTTATTTRPAATTTTAVPTSTTAVPTTTRATKARGPVGPMPTTVPPPTKAGTKLSFVAIYRYHSPVGYHITTTSAHAVPSGFTKEGPLGYLVTTNAPGTVRFYLCRMTGGQDYFSSVDQSGACEGQTRVAMLGYIYLSAPSGMQSAALYRCNSGNSHYDSLRQDCEGNGTNEGRDGYVI